jgi:hypothetical protein
VVTETSENEPEPRHESPGFSAVPAGSTARLNTPFIVNLRVEDVDVGAGATLTAVVAGAAVSLLVR